jgi:hypothetical protein
MSTILQLRQALGDVEAKYDAQREQVISLQGRLNSRKDELAEMVGKLDRAMNRATQAEASLLQLRTQLNEAQRHPPLNDRRDFEGLTRAQLLALIEGAISEARRKSMVEAEGLLSKHREMTDETDLEMMRGVVLTYQARIAAIEADRAAKVKAAATPVKLDTRPLAEKLKPQLARTSHQDFRAEYPGHLNAPALGPEKQMWWERTIASNAAASFKSFDEKTRAASKPKYGTLAEGSLVVTQGDHGTAYSLERRGDVISCSCPSWQHQKGPVTHRTCKHLGRYLGFTNEERRVTAPQPSCWCGVLLVRGQCQAHSQRWNGDERCVCGRRFSFCKEAQFEGRFLRGVTHVPRLATKV